MSRRTATAIPPQFHVGLAYVRASASRPALVAASNYIRRVGESDVRDRCAIADTVSYMLRQKQHAAAQAEVVGHATFARGEVTADEVWTAVDQAARTKEGRYHQRAGGTPRLAILAELSLPWDLPEAEKVRLSHEMAKAIVDEYGACVEVACHRKQDHPERGIDHAHLLISMREVDEKGVVGAMIRRFNGVASRSGDDRVVIGSRTLPGHIVWMRSRWACLLSDATGVEYNWRSYADQGIDLQPVVPLSREAIERDKREGGPLMAQRAAFLERRNATFLRQGERLEARHGLSLPPIDSLASKLIAITPGFDHSSFSPMALAALNPAVMNALRQDVERASDQDVTLPQDKKRCVRFRFPGPQPTGLASKLLTLTQKMTGTSFSAMSLLALETASSAAPGVTPASLSRVLRHRSSHHRSARSEGLSAKLAWGFSSSSFSPMAGVALNPAVMNAIRHDVECASDQHVMLPQDKKRSVRFEFPGPQSTGLASKLLALTQKMTGTSFSAMSLLALETASSAAPGVAPASLSRVLRHRSSQHNRSARSEGLSAKLAWGFSSSSFSPMAGVALDGIAAGLRSGALAATLPKTALLKAATPPTMTTKMPEPLLQPTFARTGPLARVSPADHASTMVARQWEALSAAEREARMREFFEEIDARARAARRSAPTSGASSFKILTEGTLNGVLAHRDQSPPSISRAAMNSRQDAAIVLGAALIICGWRTKSGEEQLAEAADMRRSDFAAAAEKKAAIMKERGLSSTDARREALSGAPVDLQHLFHLLEEERLEAKRERRRKEKEERARQADGPGTMGEAPSAVSAADPILSREKSSGTSDTGLRPNSSADTSSIPKDPSSRASLHVQRSGSPSTEAASNVDKGKTEPVSANVQSHPRRTAEQFEVLMRLAALLSWRGRLQTHLGEIARLAGTDTRTVGNQANYHLQAFSRLGMSPRELWQNVIAKARAASDGYLDVFIERITNDQAINKLRPPADQRALTGKLSEKPPSKERR